MKVSEETALTVSEYLLQIKAIKLDIANPFTWTSGKRSPIYCDNRKTLSYPKIRTYIRQEFVDSRDDRLDVLVLIDCDTQTILSMWMKFAVVVQDARN